MKKTLLFTIISLFAFANVLNAQYYYIPNINAGVNPGGLNADNEFPAGAGLDPSWTSILGPAVTTPVWSTNQNVPFAFNFNDTLVTSYKVTSTGVLTFTTTATAVPTANNVALPSALIPNRSVCVWGIEADGTNDEVVTKTFGTAPNRQHWIFFTSHSLNGGWSYWSIVLEETSNKIYIVDQRHSGTIGGVSAGIQIDASTAFSITGSPALGPQAGTDPTPADNTFYEFNFGTLPDYDVTVTELTTPLFGKLGSGDIPIGGSIQSFGGETINSFDVNYTVDGGSVVTTSVTGVSIASFGNYEFTATSWSPVSTGNYELAVWVDNINNGNVDSNNGNDTLKETISISNPIPNIIDQMLHGQRNDILITTNSGLNDPKDLDFHPDYNRKELWVINHETEGSGGSTKKYTNVGEANQIADPALTDGNAWHFMSLPTGIAFSDNGNFANSPGVFDANHRTPSPTFGFTGPALWSSDPAIYAQNAGPGTNGSHYDMLHESPYCMGIAHETENVFWVNDGWTGDVVRYDFVDDHGPGNDYHGDAIVRRYPVPVGIHSTSRTNNVEIPNHMVLDKATNWLYIVDQSSRVLRLDITSGTNGGTPAYQQLEPLVEYTQMTNITWEIYIDTGKISRAVGIEIVDNRLLVGNHDDGVISVYDLDATTATRIGIIGTKEGQGLNGIKVGPEGNIWYVNGLKNQLRKLEPWATSVDENSIERSFSIYPNPSNGIFTLINSNTESNGYNVRVTNVLGEIVMEEQSLSRNEKTYDLSNLRNGMYFMTISNDSERFTERILITK